MCRPTLRRNAFCVSCSGSPIALSTCDGSSVPDEQADPVDTAKPSRSSAISSDSASMPSNPMLVVLGTRSAPGAIDVRARHACQDALFERVTQLRLRDGVGAQS